MFGERLKQIMNEFNLSQTQLARELCISSAAIHKIKNNISKPSMGTVLILAKKFQVRYEWLLDGQGEMCLSGTLADKRAIAKDRINSVCPHSDKDLLINKLINTNEALIKSNSELISMNLVLAKQIAKFFPA